ncbi:hypothetical protein FIV38_22730 [Pseudomonas proteolytica]|nr:hypothetical protein F4W61_19135 [Pseudomonas proteolytica]TWR77067.1 hypothetical protein FIV38_22730 [Pseudomonas proteolytica]
MLGSWELSITCRARSPVGAGLPAMQTTRCICDTAPMPSQASQLLQLSVWSQNFRVAVLAAVSTPCWPLGPISCT